MADENTTAGQGPLLGWNKAQDAVSALARNVESLNKALTDATARINDMGKRPAGSTGLGMAGNDVWNRGSNFSQGRPNGGADAPATAPKMGGGSGGGTKAPNGGGVNFAPTGPQGGGSGNNGGHGGGTGGSGGGGRFGGIGNRILGRQTKGQWALNRFAYVTNWGQGKMPDQVTMNTTGYVSALQSNQSWNTLRNQAFYNNFTAQNTTDAAQAYMTIGSQGMMPGGSSFTSQWDYTKGTAGLLNVGMSQAQVAAGQASAWQAGTYNNLRMMGINTIVNGQKQNPRQIAQQIYQRFGLGRIKDARQMSATLDDPASGLNQSLQSWGLDPSLLAQVKNELKGMTSAQIRGGSASQYVKTANAYDHGNSAAGSQLAKWGIGGSSYSSLQHLAGIQRNQDVNINDAFTSGLQDATDALGKFDQVLQSILKNTGADSVIGYAGGASSILGGALSNGMGILGGLGLSNLLKGGLGGFGGGGGGLLGRLGGLFGGGGGAAGAGGAAADAGAGGLGSAVAADGVPIITTLGAGGAAAGGLGVAGTAGVVAAGGALAGFNGYMGWKYGAQPVHGWTRAAKNASIVAGMTNPISGAMNMGAMARRAWDKIHGKNKESWWGLLNPFGQEQPTGQGDGNPGGATAGSANTATGPAAAVTGTQGAGKTAAAVIAIGMKYIGTPYKWGGNSPQSGFDCSGLMQYIFKQIGVSLPRTAAQQQQAGNSVPLNEVRAGDLMFVGNPAHHVVLCIGGGKCLEAPHTGATVRVRSFSPGEFSSATRILGSVGNLGDQTNSNSNTAGSGSNRLGTMGYGGDVGAYGSVEEVNAIAGGPISIGSSIGSGVGANQNNQSNTASNGNQGAGPLPTGSLKTWIKSALGILNQDTPQNESYVNTIAMHESGGNPRAVNNWDSNAKAGHPSEGIMQTIGPTFNQYSLAGHKNIWNPVDNIIAGVRYADSRYGSLANVPGIKSLANGGGYKGYAVGSTNVDVDQTARIHKGEMIIPAYQADAIRKALAGNNALAGGLPGSGSGGGGKAQLTFHSGAIVVQVQGVMDQQSARDAAQQIMSAIAEDNRINLIAAGN